MDEKIVARYLTAIMEKEGLPDEIVAERSQTSPSTVKNLRLGKTENPGILTVAPVIYAANGSLDVMFGKSKADIDESAKNLMKEMYEFQLSEHRKTEEAHIANIRSHYEQHRQDSIDNYEKRLADKREIIKEKDEHIKTLKKEKSIAFLCAIACAGVLVGLLILEVMNPHLGWIQF